MRKIREKEAERHRAVHGRRSRASERCAGANAPRAVDADAKGHADLSARGGRRQIEIVPIVGQIEGHYLLSDNMKTTRYEQLLPHLAQIEERGEAGGVLLLLNTVGGEVEAGLAIAEMVAGMRLPTVSLVLGGGHSIGVPLATAARMSFIVPTATMTLHPVRYNGTVIGAPQSWRYLSGMQSRVLSFIEAHSGARREEVQALMLQSDDMASDLGTILTGEEAVRIGLIDRIGGLADALVALRAMGGE